MLTVDDAMEVIELEETEDFARAGGVAVATVNVLGVFEDTLEEVLALALFIPLPIDTGGNSGSQAATVVIRAMAVGEVRFSDLPRVLKRELVVGLLLGLMLGVVVIPSCGRSSASTSRW